MYTPTYQPTSSEHRACTTPASQPAKPAQARRGILPSRLVSILLAGTNGGGREHPSFAAVAAGHLPCQPVFQQAGQPGSMPASQLTRSQLTRF